MISKCHFQTLPFYDSVIVYVSMGRHRRHGAVAPAMCAVHLQSMNVPGVGWYRPHQRVLQRDGLSTPEVCPWCSQDVEEVASNQHNQEQTGVRKGLWAWEIGRNSNLTLASTTVTSRNLENFLVSISLYVKWMRFDFWEVPQVIRTAQSKVLLLGFLLLPVLNTDLLSLFLINVQKVCLKRMWHVVQSTEDASRKWKHEDLWRRLLLNTNDHKLRWPH